MYKIGVFSDVHSNKHALDALLAAHLPECNEYVFLGDCVAAGGYPNECVEAVRGVKNLTALQGNHDRDVVRFAKGELKTAENEFRAHQKFYADLMTADNVEWLAALKPSYTVEKEGVKVCFLHYKRDGEEWASPDNPPEVLKDIDADVIVYGHTHVPSDIEKYGKRFINFGTVGAPHSDKGIARVGIVTLDDSHVNATTYELPYNIEDAKAAFIALNPPRLRLSLELFYGEKSR